MRPNPWTTAVLLILAGRGVAGQPPPSVQAPARNVRELVARAGRYVVEYGEKASLVVGVEHYTQEARGAVESPPERRVLVSEFALVRAADDWVGFRDVFEVDGAAVQDRQDRLLTVLLGPSRDRLLQGRRIAEESARYNLGSIRRNFNTPTMALLFLHPKNHERFHFTKTGEETVDGARVWVVGYKETGRPTIVRTPEGRDVPASGTFWIEPSTGRVVRTRMDLHTELAQPDDADPAGDRRAPVKTTVGVTVSYSPDARFGLLLPSEMRESYEAVPARRGATRDASTTITCVATYSNFRTFETSGRVIVR